MLQQLKQKIIDIDYGFDKPKSLIVLVPIVSHIVRKIQVSDLLNNLKANYTTTTNLYNSHEYKKLNSTYRWHTAGSLIQAIALLSLVTFQPLFLIPGAFSAYEAYSTFNALGHEEIAWNPKLGLHIEK